MTDRPEWTVVKLRPDGVRAAEYRATEIPAPPGWIAVRAIWQYGRVDVGPFAFETGDVMHEYFAVDRSYNAFATFRADGTFVGWYCNVTYPTQIIGDEIHWQDLYIDVVASADGQVIVMDEDELAESGLETHDASLFRIILNARDELLALYEARAYPFTEAP